MNIAPRPGLRLEPLDDRVTPAGALDLTFGADGKLTTLISSRGDGATAVALQADGKMVAAGIIFNGTDFDFAVVRYDADGHLDTSFSGDGMVTTPVGSGNDQAWAVAVQADGKIVVAGRADVDGGSRIALVRYNPDGSLDSSFGTGGKVLTVIGDIADASAVAVQADGKVVVAGGTTTGDHSEIALARYKPDGSPDASFGVGGIVTTRVAGTAGASAVALQPDGKIVVAGSAVAAGDADFYLARYLPDGTLDPMFGAGGAVRTSLGGLDWAGGVAVLPDGRIVVAGASDAGGTADFAAARYLPDGRLDPTFNGTGTVLTPVGDGEERAYALVVQPDGKIVLAGWRSNSGSTTAAAYDFVLVRYNPDGSLDQTFDFDGKVVTPFGGRFNAAHGWAVALQADGRLVVVGDAIVLTPTFFTNGFALARYNPDGSLDRLADGTGRVVTPIGTGDDVANGMALQPDGKIVAAGWSSGDFALARYLPDGGLDPAFGGDGTVVTDFGLGQDAAACVAVQADGKIVAAGQAFNGSDSDFGLARYNPDGSLDSSFGVGGKVTTPFGGFDDVRGMAVQADGKIVVAGFTDVGGTVDFALARYLPDGTLDASFGTGGKVVTPIGGGADYATALALQPDGKIIVSGQAFNGVKNDFALARYLPNGTLDPTFGAGGKVTTGFGTSDEVSYGLAVQPDGKIVVGGYAAGGSIDFALARYLPNGNLDPTFDGDGRVITQIGPDTDILHALALQPDGKIVGAGYSLSGGTRSFALARYNPDGSPDITFDGDGKATYPGGSDEPAYAAAIQANGRIVVTGASFNGTDFDFALIRVRGDNRAPVPVPTTFALSDHQTLSVTDPAYFYDPDGDAATAELLYAPAHGAFSLTPYGTFTYTPDPNFYGTDRFAYKVSDSFGGFDVGSVVFEVSAAIEVKDDPALPGKRSLFVRGTAGDDTIVVRPKGTPVAAYLVSRNGGPFQTYTGVTGRVYVSGQDGNDSIQARAVHIPVVLDGGAGNDTMTAGWGNDTLTGGLGDDVLDGGPGIDRLVESGDVDFTLVQGRRTTDGRLTGLGTDVLVRNRIEQADLTGGAGDNRIDASAFTGRTWLRGGGGNDTLRGGSAIDLLMGGDGNDDLDGGAGRDLLIGGPGVDALAGGFGDDLLVGGATAHDDNPAALNAILAEWTSPGAYTTRVRHLQGTPAGGGNGNYRLTAATVSDDAGAADDLTGGLGLDWFVISLGDVTDRQDREQVLTI